MDPRRDEIAAVLRRVAKEAESYLEGLDARPVVEGDPAAALRAFQGSLPQNGVGADAALRELIEQAGAARYHTGGPKCFHFVMGGVTPAALGADMVAPVWDQAAYAWASSALGVGMERLALAWLRELFGLPASWGGVLTTGATMANFVGFAAAREWWSDHHGVSAAEHGLAGLPAMPVLSSGYLHPASRKALAMLGVGRDSAQIYAADRSGRLDIKGLEAALEALGGQPALVVGNAGEVNTGDFDPIAELADLSRDHNAWLHVDGAFGLFARTSARTEHLVEGVDRAQSVTSDGHKWLNVAYECGFLFVRDQKWLGQAFAYGAPYLPKADEERIVYGALGPEGSRRARAFAVWATLRAYGREGVRQMVEGHLDLAAHLARLVDKAPDLERLADVHLNIVCFRFNPGGLDERALNDLNRRLGEAVLADGRVFVGPTEYNGMAALRPALVNWRIRKEDVELLVTVVREIGARLVGARAATP